MGGANLQRVNNHFSKFEYIHVGMNTFGVTDYTN